MKYSAVIVAAAAVTGAVAQLSSIPQCALGCAISSLGSTGCQTTDIKCICQASGFIAALTPCVQSACSAADLEKTIQAATGLCAQAGVSLVIPSATSAAASATSASSEVAVTTSSVAVSTTTEAVSTTTAVVSTLTTSAVTSAYVAPNATATHGTNGTVTTGKPTGTSAIPSASQTGSAARNSVAIGGLVLAFAAALL